MYVQEPTWEQVKRARVEVVGMGVFLVVLDDFKARKLPDEWSLKYIRMN